MFIINKSIGYWCEDTSLLDDYAYQLYINYIDDIGGLYNVAFDKQFWLYSVHNKKIPIKKGEDDFVEYFYKKAIDMIRKNKLEKLNEK